MVKSGAPGSCRRLGVEVTAMRDKIQATTRPKTGETRWPFAAANHDFERQPLAIFWWLGWLGNDHQLLGVRLVPSVAGGVAGNWRFGPVSLSNTGRVWFSSSLFLSLTLFLSFRTSWRTPKGQVKIGQSDGVGYYKISGLIYHITRTLREIQQQM